MKAEIQTSIFCPQNALGAKEYHSLIRIPETGQPFEEQLDAVMDALDTLFSRKGTEVRFVRFFLSDSTNQKPAVEKATLKYPFPISYIGQPPLDATKIAAWVYSADIHDSAFLQLWSAGMTSDAESPEAQMIEIFRKYETGLSEKGITIAENCIRTWIFVRDVDLNYTGVVKGRCEYFNSIGLTSRTHYLASTGIEGRNVIPERLVTMDALAIKGLEPSQIQYLYAKDHLSPTYDYGVTFERGTAVHYGDRTHIYISGTASIDHKGEVLFVGDVAKQTDRMLDNIEALLSETGATLSETVFAIVYLRDTADKKIVKETISARCPSLLAEYVLAPVCRCTWLVEMECIAISGPRNTSYQSF